MRHSANITGSETWYAKDNPHIITGAITTWGNGTLTIEAGCKIYYNAGAYLVIGNVAGTAGSLVVNGTKSNPVLFTANTLTPTRGYYGGTRGAIKGGKLGSITLNNVIIEYPTFGLQIEQNEWTFDNVEIRECQYGIRVLNTSNFTLSNVTVHDCDDFGIRLGDSGHAVTNTKALNCLVYDCNETAGIAGIEGWKDTPIVENCTIENCIKGIWGWGSAANWLIIKNCIIINCSDKGIDCSNRGTVSYSNAWNNAGGNFHQYSDGGGNTQVDPKYVGSEDYHLQSTKGSYHDGDWDADVNDSPCIDTGDSSSSYGNESYYNGGRINMGKYGNTFEASRSSANYAIEGETTKADWDTGTKSDVDTAIDEGNLIILSETATETIIQNTGIIEINCDVYGVNDIGQQFKTTKQRLNKISVYGRKIGSPPNNCILKIWYVDEGDVYRVPLLLTSISKTSGDFGGALAYIDFTLSPEIDLPTQTNLIFTLEMESDGGDINNKYVFACSDVNPYANGNMVYSTDNWVTTNDYATDDLRFKVSEADIKSSGTWTKDYDAGSEKDWGKIYWEGSGVKFRFKSADTQGNLTGATWTAYVITSGNSILVNANRWLRVEATLET